MLDHVLGLVGEALNDAGLRFEGARILLLGVAYKRGIGEICEAPAFEVIAELRRKGAELSYADPHVPALWVDGGRIKGVELTDGALRAADCVLVLTDHRDFDYAAVARHNRLIVASATACRLPRTRADVSLRL
jgi:UDP-N-acetyl-D-glucosamine dehydrogenase